MSSTGFHCEGKRMSEKRVFDLIVCKLNIHHDCMSRASKQCSELQKVKTSLASVSAPNLTSSTTASTTASATGKITLFSIFVNVKATVDEVVIRDSIKSIATEELLPTLLDKSSCAELRSYLQSKGNGATHIDVWLAIEEYKKQPEPERKLKAKDLYGKISSCISFSNEKSNSHCSE